MHFLLTNDDGIEAPGLAALQRAVAALPDVQLTVVAPVSEYSQCGHRVTTHAPLNVRHHQVDRHAVEGTPADCVRVALFGLGMKPDWVLSGINAGGNMGQDIVISGTLAAAREAAYHGIPAMAFSHYLVRDLAVDWERTAQWTTQVIQSLMTAEPLQDGELWNVNFPHLPSGSLDLPPTRNTNPARSPLNVSFERTQEDNGGLSAFRYISTYSGRPQDEGSDVQACFGGHISISRLRV